jgi:hypothetical protein
MSDWQSIRGKVDRTVYKGSKVGFKTREIYGSALDDFNPDLEDLEDKKTAVMNAIGKISDPAHRETIEKNMTLSFAASYEKLKNTVNYERSLVPEPRPLTDAVFDSFAPQEPAIAVSFNEASYRKGLELIESLKRASEY